MELNIQMYACPIIHLCVHISFVLDYEFVLFCDSEVDWFDADAVYWYVLFETLFHEVDFITLCLF